MARSDDFLERRKHLADLSDEELKARFWELANKVVDPLIGLAQTHTSPSIERSVLMRMGIDSLTCQAVVSELVKRDLLGHGAGHAVYYCAQQWNTDVRSAAKRLAGGEGWDTIEGHWEVSNA
jgi:D-ornithine 4,5-aminomutase subunit alpha